MLDAAQTLLTITRGVDRDAWLANRAIQPAVERSIKIIGAAARFVSKPFRPAPPEVPWKKIVAQQHILAHHYGAIEHERLWRVVEAHVPDLVRQLTPLVPPIPDDGSPD